MYKVYKLLQEQLSWKETGSEKDVCMSLEEYLLVNQALFSVENYKQSYPLEFEAGNSSLVVGQVIFCVSVPFPA